MAISFAQILIESAQCKLLKLLIRHHKFSDIYRRYERHTHNHYIDIETALKSNTINFIDGKTNLLFLFLFRCKLNLNWILFPFLRIYSMRSDFICSQCSFVRCVVADLTICVRSSGAIFSCWQTVAHTLIFFEVNRSVGAVLFHKGDAATHKKIILNGPTMKHTVFKLGSINKTNKSCLLAFVSRVLFYQFPTNFLLFMK